jgi:Rps23 Pro-64 3,4-dihydroxylase Tpa1-like proline 4-hydroxylase
MVWKELEFLTSNNKMQSPTSTAGARDLAGRVVKNNYGIFLDQVFPVRNLSNILTTTRKLWNTEFIKKAEKLHWIFKYIKNSNHDATLVSYYEDNHYYLPHTDASVLTVLINLYKEPRAFTGGDLLLGDDKHIVPLENNRLIIFPSCTLHSVTPVNFKTKQQQYSAMGRYTITQFCLYATKDTMRTNHV